MHSAIARCMFLSLGKALVLKGGKTWVAINLIDDLELGLGGFKGDSIPMNRSISWREMVYFLEGDTEYLVVLLSCEAVECAGAHLTDSKLGWVGWCGFNRG